MSSQNGFQYPRCLGELRPDLLLARGRRAVDRLAGRLEFLDEDRDPDHRRVDAQGRGELDHLHDLRRGRAVAQRLLDVAANAGRVQMGRGDVDRDVDELLDLRLERRRGATGPTRSCTYASKKSGSISSTPSNTGLQ